LPNIQNFSAAGPICLKAIYGDCLKMSWRRSSWRFNSTGPPKPTKAVLRHKDHRSFIDARSSAHSGDARRRPVRPVIGVLRSPARCSGRGSREQSNGPAALGLAVAGRATPAGGAGGHWARSRDPQRECRSARYYGANATLEGWPHLNVAGRGISTGLALEHVQVATEDAPDPMEVCHGLPADGADNFGCRGDRLNHSAQ